MCKKVKAVITATFTTTLLVSLWCAFVYVSEALGQWFINNHPLILLTFAIIFVTIIIAFIWFFAYSAYMESH